MRVLQQFEYFAGLSNGCGVIDQTVSVRSVVIIKWQTRRRHPWTVIR